ncbi:MAG TPA: hypothetical protein DCM86_13845 [Verrucomicrobiales bacterium]|nr:hypothetical protein [Verrucomicrobiales bacterium]
MNRATVKADNPSTQTPPAFLAWRRQVLLATWLGYIGYYLTRNVFTTCKKSIASTGHFGSLDQVAHLWAAYHCSYMVGQFLVSALGRRTGARLLLATGLGLSIAVNLLIGGVNSYGSFLLLMVINGCAQATGWPGCVAGVAHWIAPRERAWTLGIWSTNLVVGNILVKLIAALLLVRWGWNYAFMGCALLTLAIWGVVCLWVRERPEEVGLLPPPDVAGAARLTPSESGAAQLSFREYLELATQPAILIMGAGYFAVKWVRYSLDSWLPTFYQFQDVSVLVSAKYAALFDVGGLWGMVLAGWAIHRFFSGNWGLLCLLLGLGMIVTYGFVYAVSPVPWIAACCFTLIGMMVYGADSLLKGFACVEVAGPRHGAAVAGVVNGIASLAPVIQEIWIASWLRPKDDPLLGIRHAHLLGLWFSGLLVAAMACLVWRQALLERIRGTSRHKAS